MASLKVMTSSSTSRNSDISRPSKLSSISDHNNTTKSNKNLNSMTVDGLLRNVYSDTPSSQTTLLTASNGDDANNSIRKTADDVWKEIVAGNMKECKEEPPDVDEMMTLEDFLARAEEVDDEGLKMPPPLTGSISAGTEWLSGSAFSFDSVQLNPFQARTPADGSGVLGFGNGVEVIGAGRRKRRATVLEPLGKAAQQKQRRMIKNRESAARSRERKQAYQAELEALAVKLEEEHEQLLKEKAQRTKERYKLLMEKVVPVIEQQRPARVLRRVRSMQW